MQSRLNVLDDLAQKKSLLEPAALDLDRHRALADQYCARLDWHQKLERARQNPTPITEEEFHYYQLYKPQISDADIRSYIGKDLQISLHDQCNNPAWIATSGDKALFELILKGAGLPVAKTIAILSNRHRQGVGRHLASRQDLKDFLKDQSAPLFCKPIDGMFGIGAFRIDKIEKDMVIFAGRPPEHLDDFYAYLSQFSLSGYMFQKLIRQSKSMATQFGDGVATIRFLVFNSGTPQIASAILRIPKAGAITDNFWQSGNILAAIDMGNGRISHALQNRDGTFEPVTRILGSNLAVQDHHLTDWQAAQDLVQKAASLFPKVGTQSWDIAFSTEGPVAVEYNWGGDLNIHQLAHGRGLYDEAYRAHVETCKNMRLNL